MGRTELHSSQPDQVADHSEAKDDEEVRAYFDELLQRVNNRTARVATTPMSKECKTTIVRKTNSHLVATQSTCWEMPAPRSVAPEHEIDRGKMRELATEATRSAIYTSEKQRLQQKAITCIVGAILAAALSLAFLKWSLVVYQSSMVAAWIPSVFSLICLGRVLGLSFRLKRFRSLVPSPSGHCVA
jgi:hypothetical protein